MAAETKAEMAADFTPILGELRRDIAALEARKTSLDEGEIELLDELRAQAEALQLLIDDCNDPDSTGFIGKRGPEWNN